MPKPVAYDTCPECGEALEATAKVYLSNVGVDKDGYVTSYRLAFDSDERGRIGPDASLHRSLNLEELEEMDIYCPNDHPFDLKLAKRNKRRKVKHNDEE